MRQETWRLETICLQTRGNLQTDCSHCTGCQEPHAVATISEQSGYDLLMELKTGWHDIGDPVIQWVMQTESTVSGRHQSPCCIFWVLSLTRQWLLYPVLIFCQPPSSSFSFFFFLFLLLLTGGALRPHSVYLQRWKHKALGCLVSESSLHIFFLSLRVSK